MARRWPEDGDSFGASGVTLTTAIYQLGKQRSAVKPDHKRPSAGWPPSADKFELLGARPGMLRGTATTLSCRRLLRPRRLPVSLVAARSSLCTVSRATVASPVAADSPAAASASAPSFLSDDRIRVDPSYNRWLQLVPACVAGVGIGTYASVPAVLGPFVCRAQGVVAQAPTDFAMSDLLPVATMMPLVAGLAAATLASQSEQFGHRRLAFMCSFLYPSAVYGLSALAVNAASLPLFAASYALLGGLGFYCGYPQLPPFLASTWFPDRRGLVVSIYMTSFGSGMLFAVPVLQTLLAHFRSAPVRLGGLDEVAFVLGESGQRLVLVDGVEREVVVATARDLVESGFGSSLSEGVFLLGTGSNGVCESMVATGGLVFVLMQTAFWGYRLPATRVYEPPPLPPPPAEVVAGAGAGVGVGAATGAEAVAEVAAPPTGRAAPSFDLSLQAAMATPNMYLLFAGSVGVCLCEKNRTDAAGQRDPSG